jgi:RNA polymerase sigma factor (TIGR02999 family)
MDDDPQTIFRSERPADPVREADGGPGRSSELLPHMYDELRKLAHARMRSEPAGHTLQTTALVHEAYLRVAGGANEKQWDRRGHFFGAAALAMRRILVERARYYQRERHGAGQRRVDLESNVPDDGPGFGDLVAIDQALTRLEVIDPRKAKVVTLRYFAGLSVEETAAALDVSTATVKNEWAFARRWLYRALQSEAPREDSGG